mmetsp:Transcript_2749/g.6352  ORF Transcript_2749/g.6352 Transcript_2749/m.6352 type:complete len:776 (+) Transcript_2749:68-2395(+)
MGYDEKKQNEGVHHNQASPDAIIVCLRFRPLNSREKKESGGRTVAVNFTRDDKGKISSVHMAEEAKLITRCGERFLFDQIFDQESSQDEVFEATAAPMVDDIFRGFNCTVFAYGQTGTGKSYTMMGIPEVAKQAGIIPRIVGEIFDRIENERSKEDPEFDFDVTVSYLEIYMERIKDLLNPGNAESANLKIRESKSKGIYIQGITEHRVQEAKQVYDWMAYGGLHRAVASTRMNAQSSRSHSVFIMKTSQIMIKNGSKKTSKVHLVDLAGSEKVNKTGATGKILNQASAINKSLSALGNVISALTKKGNGHVPYRDSKLTRLLTDSLGGNAKTCLIVTASPSMFNADETVSTLRFGKRAKMIKNKPKANEEKTIDEYKQMLAEAQGKIKQQKQLIDALRGGQLLTNEQSRSVAKGGDIEAKHIESDAQRGLALQIETLLEERDVLRAEIKNWKHRAADLTDDLKILEEEKAKSMKETDILQEHMRQLQTDWNMERKTMENNQQILEEENIKLITSLEEKEQIESMIASLSPPNEEVGGTSEERFANLQRRYEILVEDYKQKSMALLKKQCQLDERKLFSEKEEVKWLQDQVERYKVQAESNLMLAKARSNQMKIIEKALQEAIADRQHFQQHLFQARSRLERQLRGRLTRKARTLSSIAPPLTESDGVSDNLTELEGEDDRSEATNKTHVETLNDERSRAYVISGRMPRVVSDRTLNCSLDDTINTMEDFDLFSPASRRTSSTAFEPSPRHDLDPPPAANVNSPSLRSRKFRFSP